MAVPPPPPFPAAPPMAAEPSKPALRAELRAVRDAFVLDLAPGERARLEALAADHLMRVAGGARSIAFYVAMGSEMGCAAAIAATAARGIAVALPHVESRSAPMRFLRWTPGDPLETGWRGLSQPAAESAGIDPDLIVAPLLGFDSALNRIGQGAGFYDRAFAALPDARRIGWGWSIQQRPAIGCDPWDVPLDAVVTEAGVIEGNSA
ncbi:5-formyltetrahydrofolate cyclo-ligase [Rhizorhabdus wittichii RW1]|uniref:5-formyltetrahydrofolate cyclo-ligase n=1 Tax=Rhizorhabdus wittichii (strain DSM 6014 / CCUG 31198 / JCM 15750 / NBRC 105917 / EY 4224 / RW1) TaxID=392499 RepID=A0A9J9HCC9_RHIWR|nr:5-formyltetrahydrofolate cyclo-ligase [Rhizorhabdus wittichii RW1]